MYPALWYTIPLALCWFSFNALALPCSHLSSDSFFPPVCHRTLRMVPHAGSAPRVPCGWAAQTMAAFLCTDCLPDGIAPCCRDFQTVAPAMNVINCYELPPPENQGSQGGPGAPAATPQEGEGQGSPGGVQGEPAVERGEGGEAPAPPLGGEREGGEASEGGKTEEVEMQEDVEMVTLEEEVAQL